MEERWEVDSDKLTFNDHQAAELLHLRSLVAELRDTIEFLKADNRELTKAYYKVINEKYLRRK
jgi:hypothetical protein